MFDRKLLRWTALCFYYLKSSFSDSCLVSFHTLVVLEGYILDRCDLLCEGKSINLVILMELMDKPVTLTSVIFILKLNPASEVQFSYNINCDTSLGC